MRSFILKACALLSCCMALTCPSLVQARELTVAVQDGSIGYQLHHTGSAMRRKFFFAVYEADHYMQDATLFKGKNRHAGALSPDKAKQLVLKWERSVDSKTVRDGYQESFGLVNSKEECNAIKGEIDSFIGLFKRDVEKGDKHVLNWFPGGKVEVLVNGSLVGTIENEAFAKALWRIWFAHNGVVNRDDLLSKLK